MLLIVDCFCPFTRLGLEVPHPPTPPDLDLSHPPKRESAELGAPGENLNGFQWLDGLRWFVGCPLATMVWSHTIVEAYHPPTHPPTSESQLRWWCGRQVKGSALLCLHLISVQFSALDSSTVWCT